MNSLVPEGQLGRAGAHLADESLSPNPETVKTVICRRRARQQQLILRERRTDSARQSPATTHIPDKTETAGVPGEDPRAIHLAVELPRTLAVGGYAGELCRASDRASINKCPLGKEGERAHLELDLPPSLTERQVDIRFEDAMGSMIFSSTDLAREDRTLSRDPRTELRDVSADDVDLHKASQLLITYAVETPAYLVHRKRRRTERQAKRSVSETGIGSGRGDARRGSTPLWQHCRAHASHSHRHRSVRVTVIAALFAIVRARLVEANLAQRRFLRRGLRSLLPDARGRGHFGHFDRLGCLDLRTGWRGEKGGDRDDLRAWKRFNGRVGCCEAEVLSEISQRRIKAESTVS